MGIEVALLLITAGTAAAQYKQGKEQRRLQKEENRIQGNVEQVELRRQQRADARKARIRRAQIEQAAVNTGTSGSSGESGAVSGIGVFQGASAANANFGMVTSNILSQNNQRMADSMFRSQVIGAVGKLAQGTVGMFKPSSVSTTDPADEFDIAGDPFS